MKGNYFLFLLILHSFYSIYVESFTGIRRTNYRDFYQVAIFNKQVRSCFKCLDIVSNTSNENRFIACSVPRTLPQRFRIEQVPNTCSGYRIISEEDSLYTLRKGTNDQVEIISANNDGGVIIKLYNENFCLTNDLSNNPIDPYYLQDFEFFETCVLPYNSDDKQVFYFTPFILQSPDPPTCNGLSVYIFNKASNLNIVSNNPPDNRIYIQAHADRLNAKWTLYKHRDCTYHITENLNNLQLVSGDVFDGNVYHQNHNDRLNAKWFIDATSDGYFRISEIKHNKYLRRNPGELTYLYHNDYVDDDNFKWYFDTACTP